MKSTAHAVVVDDGDAINLDRCTIGGYHRIGTLCTAGHGDILGDNLCPAGCRCALVIAAACGSAVDTAVVAVETAIVAAATIARLGDGATIHGQRTTSTLYDIIILCR